MEGKATRARDWVSVKGLTVTTSVGVYPHERTIRQRLKFDLDLRTATAAAAREDDLRQTVDYDAIADTVRTVAGSRHHQLLETLAERIAEALFARLGPRVEQIRIRVRKPGAVPDAATVAVRIVRDHPGG